MRRLVAAALLCGAARRGEGLTRSRAGGARSLAAQRAAFATPDFSYYLTTCVPRGRRGRRAAPRSAAAARRDATARLGAARSDALDAQVRRIVADNPDTMTLETLRAERDGCARSSARFRGAQAPRAAR